MTFRKYKLARLYRSIYHAGFPQKDAAMIAYFIENKKLISENYLSIMMMVTMTETNIVKFDDQHINHFNDIKKQLDKLNK